MAELLFEIGLEEVPARMIAGAAAELERRVVAMLVRERLLAESAAAGARRFATPRRLAVLVSGVAERQEDAAEELLGPSAAIAFRDGVATPAAVAFAKKAGVSVDALTRVTTAKGEYVLALVTKPGRDAAEVIAAELPKELAAVYWAKTMYWRAGKPERFVRPVRWLLALLGEDVLPMSFAGKSSGNVTYGHRVLHGDMPVVIERPGEYEGSLKRVFVVANVEARRHHIRKALDRACRTAGQGVQATDGLRWREDHEQVETVTQLTEWPTVLLGGFEREYLALPEEVLVTVMRDHQKYFAVEDGAGTLAPHFLAVLNTEVDAAGEQVIRHGNERVLRARFSDARFFWEFDQRITLRERVALLEKVVFQKDLGSYAAKAERLRTVSAKLAKAVTGVDAVALDEAARLSKTDLTAELVKEFTELQGIVGGLYARAQGLGETAAIAIYDQYRPAGMEDAVPRSAEGALLAIADKADTIAGMFGLGMEPTGSKDPFALRRAANGIVKILAKGAIPLTLRLVAEAVTDDAVLVGRLLSFFGERLEFYLSEAEGNAYDVVAAVMAAGAEDVPDAVARAQALTEVRAENATAGDFAAVSAAFKRMSNILEQAREKGVALPAAVDIALLLEPEEMALAERSQEIANEVRAMRAAREYGPALRVIASLRPQVDDFFDAVMVMVPEPEMRGNRLALLARVLSDLSGIADFSKIVVAG